MIKVGQIWVNDDVKITVVGEDDEAFYYSVPGQSSARFNKRRFYPALIEFGWKLSEVDQVETILKNYEETMGS